MTRVKFTTICLMSDAEKQRIAALWFRAKLENLKMTDEEREGMQQELVNHKVCGTCGSKLVIRPRSGTDESHVNCAKGCKDNFVWKGKWTGTVVPLEQQGSE